MMPHPAPNTRVKFAALEKPSVWRCIPVANATARKNLPRRSITRQRGHRCRPTAMLPNSWTSRGTIGCLRTWPRLQATLSGDEWSVNDDGLFISRTCGEVNLSDPEIVSLTETILRSFSLTFPNEDPLVSAIGAQVPNAEVVALFLAPFAVLAHDRVELPDGSRTNVYNYANKRGLEVFERTWEEHCAVPSVRSAASSGDAQSGRNTLISQCLHQGWQDVSGAVRQSSTGKAITLKCGKLWNLTDENGVYAGQAVVITQVIIE